MAGNEEGKMEGTREIGTQTDIHNHKLESTRGDCNLIPFFLPLT